jgi:hypothetical protein
VGGIESDDGAAGSASAEAGSGGAGGAAQQSYPAGPYGTALGDVLEDLCFQGLRDPKSSSYMGGGETICLHDYYNPTRAADAPRVLVITISAMWCEPCKLEEKSAQANRDYWAPLGAEFMTALSEDLATAPPTLKNAQTWSAAFKLDFPVVLDGEKRLFQYFDTDGYPKHLLLDLASMKLTSATVGDFDVSPDSVTLKAATAG